MNVHCHKLVPIPDITLDVARTNKQNKTNNYRPDLAATPLVSSVSTWYRAPPLGVARRRLVPLHAAWCRSEAAWRVAALGGLGVHALAGWAALRWLWDLGSVCYADEFSVPVCATPGAPG